MNKIYLVELHDYDCDEVVGYFTSEESAKICCDYLNAARPSNYEDCNKHWYITCYAENVINYSQLMKQFTAQKAKEEQEKQEAIKAKELAELARLKAKYEGENI